MQKVFSKLHHEHWPTPVFYLPVFFYYLYNSAKLRSLNYFTRVNPSLKTGGLCGFSKYKSYKLLPESLVPKSIFLKKGSFQSEQVVLDDLVRMGLSFPLILKPDQGERGFLVHLVKTKEELFSLLETYAQNVDFLIQENIEGPLELGVFLIKIKGRWKISSLTSKNFMSVVGDGESSLKDLILKSEIESHYLKEAGYSEDYILAKGQNLILEPIGNHCRGTEFINECDKISPDLEESFNEALKNSLEGINYCRLDLRTESWESLLKGEFKALEINGVSAEPAHIYDPELSLSQAYKDLFFHWRSMAEIAKDNMEFAEPLKETIGLVSTHFKNKKAMNLKPKPMREGLSLESYIKQSPDFYKKDAYEILEELASLISYTDEKLYQNKEPKKPYCRVSLFKNTDAELVLCRWKAGVKSEVHFHPLQDCWFKNLSGEIMEIRDGGQIKAKIKSSEVGYINDDMGAHQMKNESNQTVYTLHFYRKRS